jgi:hypothetical protein
MDLMPLISHMAPALTNPPPANSNPYKVELATGMRVVVWILFGVAGLSAAWKLLHLPLTSLTDSADADVASRRGLFSRLFRTLLPLVLTLLLLSLIAGMISSLISQWQKS